MGKIKAVIILLFILCGLIMLYSYLNGNNMQQTLWDFLKKDGLKALITFVFITIGALIIQMISGIKLSGIKLV